MPVNYHNHGSIDGVAPSEEPKLPPKDPQVDWWNFFPDTPWSWHVPAPSLYHMTHLISTYVFTAFILRALYKGFNKFVRLRQLYALDLLQSIPARTVQIRNLPDHLQKERDLAEYFESMGFTVESTVVVRQVRGLKHLLAQRANALFALERAWCKWLGNPTTAENYEPDAVVQVSEERAESLANGGERLLVSQSVSSYDEERQALMRSVDRLPDPAANIRAPEDRPRPKLRINRWNPFSPSVDAITLLETRYRTLDAAVQKIRAKACPPSSVGFVTFVDAMSAQIASEAVHYPLPALCKTSLAPEPRDIIWSNVSIPSNERRVRQLLVSAFTFALFVFYIPPLAFLASLLSSDTIKKYLPGLYSLIKRDQRLMAFVNTSLPSVAVTGFNALLPLILEWTAYLQGLKARSLVEFSVLKRYHLFLLTSVIFIFLITRTALGVLTDLATKPMKIIDKLSQSLPLARHFSLSYVVFQSVAVVPLQLLQLPITLGRAFGRLSALTPREHAELNAPPQLYAGSVYPAALIVVTLCIVYSIVSPLITLFGALYFAVAYLVYKYKLLFVFYRSYESRGQAWPLCTTRIVWALCLFQIFQFSLFSFRKQFFLSTMMIPLIVFTAWFNVFLSRTFGHLSEYVNLSSIAEINKPLLSATVDQNSTRDAASSVRSDRQAPPRGDRNKNPIVDLRIRALDSLDPSETVLARKRYSSKDETLFVAQKDKHTDYREPPAGGYYFGTLNTGRRQYGHPAMTGILPELWPPVRLEVEEEKSQEQDGENPPNDNIVETTSLDPESERRRVASIPRIRRSSKQKEAVVLSLRRRKSSLVPATGSHVSSDLRSPSRRSRKRSAFGSTLETSSTPHDAVSDSPHKSSSAISSLAFPSTSNEIPEGEACEEPGHQHEDVRDVWGPSASSKTALSSERPQDGSRLLPSINRVEEETGSGEESDGGSEDEYAGVYIHRNARNDRVPGSFPGLHD